MGKIGNRKSILYGKATLPGDTEVLVDSSGRLLIDAALLGGVAPQLDDIDKLAVSLYGKLTDAGDTAVLLGNQGKQGVFIGPINSPAVAVVPTAGNDGITNSTVKLGTYASNEVYNGVTWDRLRNNESLTLLASAQRVAVANSPDQVNYNAKGLFVYVDVTARVAATTLEVKITGKDPIGGDYINLWVAAAAINTADASFMYTIYPVGAADAAYLTTENVIGVIPRDWRLTVTPSDGSGVTYSVACLMIL